MTTVDLRRSGAGFQRRLDSTDVGERRCTPRLCSSAQGTLITTTAGG